MRKQISQDSDSQEEEVGDLDTRGGWRRRRRRKRVEEEEGGGGG